MIFTVHPSCSHSLISPTMRLSRLKYLVWVVIGYIRILLKDGFPMLSDLKYRMCLIWRQRTAKQAAYARRLRGRLGGLYPNLLLSPFEQV